MNERQHIALTEAQIIAAEKGELKLEYRNGENVCQLVWFRPPCNQNGSAIKTLDSRGDIRNHCIGGKSKHAEYFDLFISEAQEIPAAPMYEVGEIIEMSNGDSLWFDIEVIAISKNLIFGWKSDLPFNSMGYSHRKKQTEKTVTLDGKTMTVKEALKYLTNL